MVTLNDARVASKVTEFWSKVKQGQADECWPWTGYVEDGYGRFHWRGKMVGSHELALTFTTGERRHSSLDTCHRCGNPVCCNPSHLRFDTRASNVADSLAHGTHRAGPGKLTEADVVTIRNRRAMGAQQQTLADQYGVSNGLISQIVRGLRWSKVGGPIQTERKYENGR